MGPSGSGKSTLMHCAAGLDTLTSGSAFIGEAELSGLDDRRLTLLRRERVGFVFQAFNLLPTLNVAENITLPMDLAGARPDAAWVDALIKVTGLGDRLHHRPKELSGGQQQRVAIARALITHPALLLADEPTGNLDSRSSADLMALFDELNEQGITIVLVTHEADIAAHAARVLTVHDGLLASDAATQRRSTNGMLSAARPEDDRLTDQQLDQHGGAL
jgi:putative ABC transport system ATP-binding protein